MGYCTRYHLAYYRGDNPYDADASEIPEIEEAKKTIYDGYDPFEGDEVRWYDHQDDMKALSLLYPDVFFTLEGNGENNEDMWVEYYKNGKMQREEAIITFLPFDPSKLR